MRIPLSFSPAWLKFGALALALFVAFWLGQRLPDGNSSGHPNEPEFEQAPDTERPSFRFTPPKPLKRLITEWEPQRALVLGISFAETMSAPDIAQYQINLIEIAHRYHDVLVFSDHDQTQPHAYFLAQIRDQPQADSILAKTHFIDARNLMRWTRDFGPIFGLSRHDQLIAIDNVYRNLNRDLEEAAYQENDSFRRFMTHQGDAMPGDLAVEIEERYEIPVELVRPPIMLDGGDFVHDGRGNVFISTRTLVRNGGNRHTLEELFRHYYGAKKLHVLQALPGATVAHLDMIFKFVDDRTVVLPEFHANAKDDLFNPYRTDLVKRVQEVLASNERYLRRNFPQLRIIKMPMPPIQFQAPEEILEEAIYEFVRIIALSRGIVEPEQLESLDDANRLELRAKVNDIIRKEIGPIKLETAEGFNAVLRAYGQAPLKKLFDIHSESVTRYLSYINSVFLHNEHGDHGFIVPRFTSPNPSFNERLMAWELEVEEAYRQAWPLANIHWINCDSFVADSGYVHCTTITVPALPKLQN
jgi:agmatine/peptidylarginine deiminase